ncbi:MAG: PLP-dependent aspartate aminotransferase family protein [Spirochaetaceae bacterium]|jgi:cystathionine beta-lyase/cystathionine gamma-synthase|nr:PLP-dependent aspartate aminotransferase family protein [Spirochaetaceae bacterium]
MDKGTELIHNGHDMDPATGALGVAVYQTSTYHRKDITVMGEFDYSRGGNPTRKALEEAIASLEGGAAGYAFASGMSGISSVMGMLSTGDHIVIAEDVYGGSRYIAETFYKRWGLECAAVNTQDPDSINRALKPNTKALYLESPSNPLLKITDLRACLGIAKQEGLLSIVDNTFMTPYLQRPIELGADIVVHSATKYLGGHCDVISGLVVTRTAELGQRLYQIQNSFGAVQGPWDAWLVMRGIKTLKVRIETQQDSALKIASWLLEHKNVTGVNYPGLSGHPGRDIHFSQASGGGAMLSFKTRTTEQALGFFSRIKLAVAAPSLGGVETIASYPVKMSHINMPAPEREAMGITDNLIRISVGLETAEDLIADFAQALDG